MNSYKEYRFCSNCQQKGSLKYVGHTHGTEYICRACWDKLYEVQKRMKKSITPNAVYFYYRNCHETILLDENLNEIH